MLIVTLTPADGLAPEIFAEFEALADAMKLITRDVVCGAPVEAGSRLVSTLINWSEKEGRSGISKSGGIFGGRICSMRERKDEVDGLHAPVIYQGHNDD
jgi:hypothetical protein